MRASSRSRRKFWAFPAIFAAWGGFVICARTLDETRAHRERGMPDLTVIEGTRPTRALGL